MSHVLLTDEQAQQIEEALKRVINDWVAPDDLPFEDGEMPALDGAREALATIQAALAEPQITTPDVCGEVCARAKLCYGCNKDLEEANAKYAEQERLMTDTELINANCRYTTPLMAEQAEQEPAPWKHDCAALCANGIELWIDNCPHCGKPRTAPSEPVKQEPVAWMDCYGEVRNDRELSDLKAAGSYTKASTYDRPLYAAPVRTKDLTDDEIYELMCKFQWGEGRAFARAVIAADRELNK